MAFSMNITREDVYPPYPTFEETIAEYTAKVDYVTSAKILDGFDFEYQDKEGSTTTYHFSYKSDDQQNFSTQNEMALLVANNTIVQLQAKLAEATKQLSDLVTGADTADLKPENTNDVVSAFSKMMSDPSTVGTTDTFTTSWQGHTADGSAVTLNFNYDQFIKFTVAAGLHKQNAIGEGWFWKARFRACRSDEELEDLAETMGLDQKVVAAREIYKKLGITTEKEY